jgi:hypothetical protein
MKPFSSAYARQEKATAVWIGRIAGRSTISCGMKPEGKRSIEAAVGRLSFPARC